MELEKTNPGKKLFENILLPLFFWGQLVVQLYLLYLSCSVNMV